MVAGLFLYYNCMTNSNMPVLQKSGGGLIHNYTSKRGNPLQLTIKISSFDAMTSD